MSATRRLAVLVLALLPAAVAAVAQTSSNSQISVGAPGLALTPRQTEGPYYPTAKLADRDNDLTRVGGGSLARGEVLLLSGRLVDQRNQPIAAARIEIWQADHQGIYMHPGDAGTMRRDRDFQFYGEATTSPSGAFNFRTIMPGYYGTRPRHIHVKVVPMRGAELTTQIYFEGDQRLSSDGIVRRLGDRISALLVKSTQTGPGEHSGQISFVLRQD
jgi:protocatechuate 3,4-dioxygenase beta subunit